MRQLPRSLHVQGKLRARTGLDGPAAAQAREELQVCARLEALAASCQRPGRLWKQAACLASCTSLAAFMSSVEHRVQCRMRQAQQLMHAWTPAPARCSGLPSAAASLQVQRPLSQCAQRLCLRHAQRMSLWRALRAYPQHAQHLSM